MSHAAKEFKPAHVAVLTVSDTRNLETDTSGQYYVDNLIEAGHKVVDRAIVIDDIYKIRAIVSKWIADENVQVIISTGGTGFTARDYTPEALMPLFDKEIEGFGELFRAISYQEIGTSTVQSRALGGFANKTVILATPGSTNACRTAWTKIIKEQLDSRHRPCNFMPHVKVIAEEA
ncbi:Molybdenum cofactor biosynthesis protein B [Vibrio stylophorae]|uniref:Molybdenum cofactor biosynthesis protein B n=1 Tax=Vibrio stylophorae TaxID=659351 RepID=A0ABM8ZSN0_9VIBR|nr:molybdenum cofactor biosynthesis protein B [Vibrio stylophorae]CAH0533317.1 Molybdenum cofactor biosynthesis protein B [Vibrio stylophorae]